MVNPRDIPNKTLPEQKVPASKGHEGALVQSSVEGTGKYTGEDSIGTNKRSKNIN